METKRFYRVTSYSDKGLWYKPDGTPTDMIKELLPNSEVSELPMPFDEKLSGYISAADSMDQMYQWFNKEQIKALNRRGYFVFVFESDDYFFNVNHWCINQKTSKFLYAMNGSYYEAFCPNCGLEAHHHAKEFLMARTYTSPLDWDEGEPFFDSPTDAVDADYFYCDRCGADFVAFATTPPKKGGE